jgi:signal transduction histidine kinase
VFRIAEEALRNVERHAQAQQVQLGLHCQGEAPQAQVQLRVADDGQGFDPAQPQPGHFGLRGMHEQAALIHAELQVRSAPGQGCELVLSYRA